MQDLKQFLGELSQCSGHDIVINRELLKSFLSELIVVKGSMSTSEAQRMIEQGGVKLDGERVSDKGLKIPAGRTVVAQVGKRRFARITVK